MTQEFVNYASSWQTFMMRTHLTSPCLRSFRSLCVNLINYVEKSQIENLLCLLAGFRIRMRSSLVETVVSSADCG